MLFRKLSFLLSLSFNLQAQTYDTACLNSIFSTSIKKDQFILNLVERKLSVNKKECIIEIHDNYLKFFTTYWKVDFCRGPVHIREGKDFKDIIKKEVNCESSKRAPEDNFCQTYKKLIGNLNENSKITLLQLLANLLQDYTKYECATLTRTIGKISLYDVSRMFKFDFEGLYKIKQDLLALSSKMEIEKIADFLTAKLTSLLNTWQCKTEESIINTIFKKFINAIIQVISNENISVTKFNSFIEKAIYDLIFDFLDLLNKSDSTSSLFPDNYFAVSEIIICLLSLIVGENLVRYFFDEGVYLSLGKSDTSMLQKHHYFLNEFIKDVSNKKNSDEKLNETEQKNVSSSSTEYNNFDVDLLFSQDVIDEISKEDSKKEFTKMNSMTSFYNDTSSFK